MVSKFYEYDKQFRKILLMQSEESGIPVDDVIDIYETYFKGVSKLISTNDVGRKDTFEEIEELNTTISIPKIGKLYADRYSFNRNKSFKKNRANQIKTK